MHGKFLKTGQICDNVTLNGGGGDSHFFTKICVIKLLNFSNYPHQNRSYRKKFIYIHIHIHSYSITIHKLFRVVRYIVYLTIFIYTCFGYLRASLRRPTVLQYNTIAAIIVYRIAKRLWFIVCSFFLLKRECGRARIVTALLSYSSKCLIGRDVVMS